MRTRLLYLKLLPPLPDMGAYEFQPQPSATLHGRALRRTRASSVCGPQVSHYRTSLIWIPTFTEFRA